MSDTSIRDEDGHVNPVVFDELSEATERAIILAALEPVELADLAEHLRIIRHERQAAVESAAESIREVEATLEQRLGMGEVVVSTMTGRIAYKDLVSNGKATINTDALDELRPQLPPGLRPEPTTKYPSVSDLRKAKSTLRKLGIRLGAVLNEPPKVPGLRWRTLSDGSADDGD